MMHFELESDREVTVDAIGLLPAGEPVVVSEEAQTLFEALHGTTLAEANFPAFVKVTAVVDTDGGV